MKGLLHARAFEKATIRKVLDRKKNEETEANLEVVEEAVEEAAEVPVDEAAEQVLEEDLEEATEVSTGNTEATEKRKQEKEAFVSSVLGAISGWSNEVFRQLLKKFTTKDGCVEVLTLGPRKKAVVAISQDD